MHDQARYLGQIIDATMNTYSREERREIELEKVEKKVVSANDIILSSVLQMHCSMTGS